MLSRRYRRNSLFSISRTDRIFLDTIIDLFYTLSRIAKFIYRNICKSTHLTVKTIRNINALKKIGYTTDNIYNILYSLSPRGFEIFVAELYKAQGYNVVLTQNSNDYGRDVILKTNAGDIFIECKRYSNGNLALGREIAQKLLGSVQRFGAIKGIIITTGQFHKNAYEVERMVNNLELIDIDDIMIMLMKLDTEKISRILLKAKNVA